MRKIVAAAALSIGLCAGSLALPLTSAHAGTTWLVGLKASRAATVAGHKVVFTGTVRSKAAASGHQVVLQEKFRPGKPWVDQRKATVQDDGTYRVADRPTVNTTHAYRVVMPAYGAHARGVSATAKVTVYAWTPLTSLRAVNRSGMSFGTVTMNGGSFPQSVYADGTWSTSVEFNVDHNCTALRARFGISDDSTTGGQAEVGVLADGTQIYTHTFDVGQTQQQTLSLASPLKLQLKARSTSTGDARGLGAFGSALALCTR